MNIKDIKVVSQDRQPIKVRASIKAGKNVIPSLPNSSKNGSPFKAEPQTSLLKLGNLEITGDQIVIEKDNSSNISNGDADYVKIHTV